MEIDICLATKNSFQTLPKLFKSIKEQENCPKFRVLVADNQSTDGTIEFLNKYSFCRIISFKDNCPEEGFNKLLKEKTNNLKIIVGSDDYLSKNYLNSFIQTADYLKCNGIKKFILLPLFYKNFKSYLFRIDLPIPIFFLKFIGISRGIGFGIYCENSMPRFSYETQYASDYDFLLNCYLKNFYFKYVPTRYFHFKGGRSSINWEQAFNEERKISLKYNKNIISRILILNLFTLKYVIRKLNQLIKCFI